MDGLPSPIDPETALRLLVAAREQVAVALWLSAGMVAATAMVLFIAGSFRRSALGCGLVYGVTLCFVPVGHARVLGPCAIAAALIALLWPRPGCGGRT